MVTASRRPIPLIGVGALCLALVTGPLVLAQNGKKLLDCEGEDADSEDCINEPRAFELRARIDAILPGLKEISNPPWDLEKFEQLLELRDHGLEQYDQQTYSLATQSLSETLEGLKECQEEFMSTTQKYRNEITEALAGSQYDFAAKRLTSLIHWFPGETELIELLEKANRGLEFKSTIEDIQSYLSEGQFVPASVLIEQIPDGYWANELNQAKRSVQILQGTADFNALMSSGYKLLDEGDVGNALLSFERAVQLQPASPVAQEALDQTQSLVKADMIETMFERLKQEQLTDSWEAVLVTVDELEPMTERKVKSDLVKKREKFQGLIKAEKLMDEYLQIEVRQLNASVREKLQDFHSSSDHLSDYPRTRQRFSKLVDLIERYSTPIEITVKSDRRTTVEIRPGKKLGRISSKQVKLLPGTYTLVGMRRGHQQVTQEITITPDSESIEVSVVCDVRF